MLVPVRVSQTFLAADAARRDARVQHLSDHLFVGTRSPRSERCHRIADVSAVEIETNALAKLRNHLLRETRVGARGTRMSKGVLRF